MIMETNEKLIAVVEIGGDKATLNSGQELMIWRKHTMRNQRI